MSDARFARLRTDPRFRRPKKAKAKVVVDDRFKSIFDKDDKKEKRVDKYGRKVSKSANRDNLQRFYRLGDGDDDDEQENDAKPDLARGEGLVESSSEEDDDDAAQDDEDDEDGLVVLGRDASKPIPVGEDEIDLDENTIAELDAQAASYSRQAAREQQGKDEPEPTTRIAVVNLDWDHVKASLLFKIFSSVDKIRSVRVYPSEFGKERMAREEREGPPQEVFGKGKRQESDEEEVNERTIYEVNDGEDYDQDALRKYQLERLRYYYAVVTCDSVQAAEHIYNELEGTELERSANVLDLSYVPEDMTFDDECRDEAMEEVADFKAVDFTTDALRHSKVKLTWDADDPDRTRITRRTLTRKDLDEIDFKAYIASDSEEDDEDDEARREKMRNLLLRDGSDEENDQLPEGWGTGKPDKAGEMEITFMPGLSASTKDNSGGKESDDEQETTLEKYRRKTKEKKAAKKAARTAKRSGGDAGGDDEFFGAGSDSDDAKPRKDASKQDLEALIEENEADGGDGLQHFDMRAVVRADKVSKAKGKLAKKMKKKLERGGHADETGEGFMLDVADPRFGALHEDPAFAIDPSNPKFKRTKGMDALLEERSRRQQRAKGAPEDGEGNLKNLVESVKRKVKANDSSGRAGKRQRVDS
ncbi:hypothetical protein EXIGLDRAFT_744513 [Exidia glandulosa HHB12029]|uniref:Uncharacterized protein n=1 Tax=Exidia glandulosa HHB12029 TaxID=1314781 RepID=A0A166BNF7_EXIGL|nr:hypothetical protein EXIGLDRAFT_744513 [Exidia glandulosa HHB12029]